MIEPENNQPVQEQPEEQVTQQQFGLQIPHFVNQYDRKGISVDDEEDNRLRVED